MPVAAKFVADFSSFTQALDRAQLELRTFDREVGKIDASLAKFGDQFSGRKVLTEAALATKAVLDLGGAATLTQKEQAKLNTVLVDAIDKYAVLGKTAPKAMVDLEKATRDAAQATSTASSWWADLGKSVLGTMTGFLSAQAILGAVSTAVGLVKDQLVSMTLGGAAVADVSDSFERLTEQAGLLGSSLLGDLRAGTHATITDLDLMKSVNQALAAGFVLTNDKASLLARGAFALAQATGGDVKTAFDALNEAMLTGQTRSVALLTGRIDLEAAETKYANALGIARADLDETQKLEAKRAAVLDSVSAAVGRLGTQTDGLDEKVQQAQVAWANFQNDLGKAINRSPVLVAAIDEIGKILKQTFGGDTSRLVDTLARAFDEALIAVVEFGRSATTAAGFVIKEWHAAMKVAGNLAQIIDGVVVASLYLEKAQLSVSHALGLNEAAWRRNDQALQDTMVRMLERGKALQEHTQAQANVDKATLAFDATLAQLQARMEASRVEHVAGAEAALTLGKAHVQLGTDVGTVAAQVRLTREELAQLKAAGEGWRGTLAKMNAATVDGIKGYLEAGVAQGILAKHYGVTAVQVRAVASAMEDEKKQLEQTKKSVAETGEVWRQYYALRSEHGGTSTDMQLAQIQRWFDDETAKIKTSDANWQAHYDALAALAGEKRRSVLVDWKAIADNQRSVLQQTADKAIATYQYMWEHADQFTSDTIEQFWKIAEEAQKAADAWGTSFNSALDGVAAKAAGTAAAMTGAADRLAEQTMETQKILAFSFDNPYALDAKSTPEEMAKRATDLGGTVARDSYGNPYVHVPGKNLPGANTPSWFRASGGPVSKGHPYVVGERGPELFVPSTTGAIAPGLGGGAVTLTVHVDARESFFDSAAGQQRLADRVGAALLAQWRSRGGAVAGMGG